MVSEAGAGCKVKVEQENRCGVSEKLLEASQISADDLTGVMDVNDPPVTIFPMIDLRFTALRV